MSQNDEIKGDIKDYFLHSEAVTKHSWLKGEFLCREGGELGELHFLQSGRFRIFRSLSNGREMLYRVYLPGSVIGDIEVFSGGESASCSVQCIEAAVTLTLPVSSLRNNPAEAPELIFALGRGIARKLHENSVSEALNTVYPLEVRLAHYYLTFTDQSLQAQNLGQLADWMGCSYRHLTRSLSVLRSRGALKHSGSMHQIADIDVLESIAEPMTMEERGRVLFEPGD